MADRADAMAVQNIIHARRETPFCDPMRACSASARLARIIFGAVALVLWLGLAGHTASAGAQSDLYAARTFVTGQREENRLPAFERCLRDVLVKVSGDSRIEDKPALAEIAADTGSFVTGFSYRDRMAGVPVHDEQGTRDRPYDLTVTFDPAKVDAALLKLGRRPWPEPRPKIVLFVRVLNGPNSFILDRDRERGRDMREAIAAAAWRLGLSLKTPESSALQKAALDPEILLQSDPSKLTALARSAGGDVAVWGSLVWAPSSNGWVADWRLHYDGETHRWREAGVSFDRAFYAAAAGAAQILSVGVPPS